MEVTSGLELFEVNIEGASNAPGCPDSRSNCAPQGLTLVRIFVHFHKVRVRKVIRRLRSQSYYRSKQGYWGDRNVRLGMYILCMCGSANGYK